MPKQPSKAAPASPSRRRRRSSEEVADRILEAAVEEFEQSGFSGATTAAIARRAEVTEAQIFRFYESKQQLFHAAIFEPLNRHFADFHARNAAAMQNVVTDRELAYRYIHELQDFMERHSRKLMSLIVASAYSPDTTEGVSQMEGLRNYFELGAATMAKRVDENAKVSPPLMVRVSFAAVLANLMFKDWLFPPGMASKTEIRDAIAEFVIDGIRANDMDGL